MADVFAAGVILYLLCFREYPFDPNDPINSYQKYLDDKDTFWSYPNPPLELRELLDAIFERD